MAAPRPIVGRVVPATMLAHGHDLEVFDPVVESVAVLVVNHFAVFNRAAEMCRHDVPMLQDSLTVDADNAVSVLQSSTLPRGMEWATALPHVFVVASAAAELAGVPTQETALE